MKKIVIVNGNPEAKSLGTSAAKLLEKNAKEQGCEVTYFDAKDFPFITKNPALHGGDNAFDLPVEAIIDCDQLVMLSPMWNFSVTGVLKNFMDGIVQVDKLFKFTKKGPEGLLKTPKMLMVWTTGGPLWVYKILFCNPMKKSVWPIFKFCGIKKYQEFSAGSFMGKDEAKEKAVAQELLDKIDNYKF